MLVLVCTDGIFVCQLIISFSTACINCIYANLQSGQVASVQCSSCRLWQSACSRINDVMALTILKLFILYLDNKSLEIWRQRAQEIPNICGRCQWRNEVFQTCEIQKGDHHLKWLVYLVCFCSLKLFKILFYLYLKID